MLAADKLVSSASATVDAELSYGLVYVPTELICTKQ